VVRVSETLFVKIKHRPKDENASSNQGNRRNVVLSHSQNALQIIIIKVVFRKTINYLSNCGGNLDSNAATSC